MMEFQPFSNISQHNVNQSQIQEFTFEKFDKELGKVTLFFKDNNLSANINQEDYSVKIKLPSDFLNKGYSYNLLIQALSEGRIQCNMEIIEDKQLQIELFPTEGRLLGGGVCNSKSSKSLDKMKNEALEIPNIEQINLQNEIDNIANQLKYCLTKDILEGAIQAIQKLGRIEIKNIPDPQIILENLLETLLHAKHTTQREFLFILLAQLIDAYARLVYAKNSHNLLRDIESKNKLIHRIANIIDMWEDRESFGYDISYHLEAAKTILELSKDTDKINYTQHFLDVGSTVINLISGGRLATDLSIKLKYEFINYVLEKLKQFNNKFQISKMLLFDKISGNANIAIVDEGKKIICQAQYYLQQALNSKNVDWKVLYAGLNFLGQCLMKVTDLDLAMQILIGRNDFKDNKPLHYIGILELKGFSENINFQSIFNYKKYSLCIRSKVVQICLMFIEPSNNESKPYFNSPGFKTLVSKVSNFINEREKLETDPKIWLLLKNPHYQFEIDKIWSHNWEYKSGKQILENLLHQQTEVKDDIKIVLGKEINKTFVLEYMHAYNLQTYKKQELIFDKTAKNSRLVLDLHFNLVLINDNSEKKGKKDVSKKLIEFQDVFKLSKFNDFEYKILLLGSLGIGKSTACRYLINKCQSDVDLLKKFKLIIYISMDNLDNNYYKNKKRTLAEMVFNEFFSGYHNQLSKQQFIELQRILEEMRQETLVIIDNYDESIATVKKGGNLEIAFKQLCSFPHQVITSLSKQVVHEYVRPNIQIELLGLNQKNIKSYINYYFNNNPARATELIDLMQKQSSLINIAKIPLQLETFCTLLKYDEKSLKNLKSMTDIFYYFNNLLFKYEYSERKMLKDKTNNLLVSKTTHFWDTLLINNSYATGLKVILCELAWQGMINGVSQFEKSYLKKISDNILMKQSDFLTIWKKWSIKEDISEVKFREILDRCSFIIKSGRENNLSYSFLHLTFQEYFAAQYLIYLLQNNPDKFKQIMSEHKFNSRMGNVWRFCVGLLNIEAKIDIVQSELLVKFFDYLALTPHDLVGAYALELYIRCFEEAEIFSTLKSRGGEIRKQGIEQIKTFIKFEFTKRIVKDFCPRILPAALIILYKSPQVLMLSGAYEFYCTKLRSPDIKEWSAALEALVNIIKCQENVDYKTIAAIVDLLNNKDTQQSIKVIGILSEIVKSGKELQLNVINIILNILDNKAQDNYDQLVCAIFNFIGDIAQHNQQLPDNITLYIVNFLNNLDPNLQKPIFDTLANIIRNGRKLDHKVMDIIISFLKIDKPERSLIILNGLARIAQSGQKFEDEIIEHIVSFLDNSQWHLQQEALHTLGKVVSSGQQLHPKIISLIMGYMFCDNLPMRNFAFTALGYIASNGQRLENNIIISIIDLLKDPTYRDLIFNVLENIVSVEYSLEDNYIEEIKSFLREDNGQMLQVGIKAFASLARGGQRFDSDFIKYLRTFLNHVDREIRLSTMHVFANITRNRQKVDDEFIKDVGSYFNDIDKEIQILVIEVLGNIIKNGQIVEEQLIEEIVNFLKLKNKDLQMIVLNVLGDIVKNAQKLNPEILVIIYDLIQNNDNDRDLQAASLNALANIVKNGQILESYRITRIFKLIEDQNNEGLRLEILNILLNVVNNEQKLENEVIMTIIKLIENQNEDKVVRQIALNILEVVINSEQKLEQDAMMLIIDFMSDSKHHLRPLVYETLSEVLSLGYLITQIDDLLVNNKYANYIIEHLIDQNQACFVDDNKFCWWENNILNQVIIKDNSNLTILINLIYQNQPHHLKFRF